MVSKWNVGRNDWIRLLAGLQEEGYQKEIPKHVLITKISQHWDMAHVSHIMRVMKDANTLGLIKAIGPATFEITAPELTEKEKEE